MTDFNDSDDSIPWAGNMFNMFPPPAPRRDPNGIPYPANAVFDIANFTVTIRNDKNPDQFQKVFETLNIGTTDKVLFNSEQQCFEKNYRTIDQVYLLVENIISAIWCIEEANHTPSGEFSVSIHRTQNNMTKYIKIVYNNQDDVMELFNKYCGESIKKEVRFGLRL